MTYLGADNAIPAPETPPGGPTTAVSAFEFITNAAAEASTAPPTLTSLQTKGVPMAGTVRDTDEGGCNAGSGFVAVVGRDIEGLEELDERAADEACTPAGAAQALARIACRLFEMADSLGGIVTNQTPRGVLFYVVSRNSAVVQ